MLVRMTTNHKKATASRSLCHSTPQPLYQGPEKPEERSHVELLARKKVEHKVGGSSLVPMLKSTSERWCRPPWGGWWGWSAGWCCRAGGFGRTAAGCTAASTDHLRRTRPGWCRWTRSSGNASRLSPPEKEASMIWMWFHRLKTTLLVPWNPAALFITQNKFYYSKQDSFHLGYVLPSNVVCTSYWALLNYIERWLSSFNELWLDPKMVLYRNSAIKLSFKKSIRHIFKSWRKEFEPKRRQIRAHG